MTNGDVLWNLINNNHRYNSTAHVVGNNHSHSSAYSNSNNSSNSVNNNDHRPRITVDLLPWNLKMRSQKEIRTEGLFASLNDCLYRSMYR